MKLITVEEETSKRIPIVEKDRLTIKSSSIFYLPSSFSVFSIPATTFHLNSVRQNESFAVNIAL